MTTTKLSNGMNVIKLANTVNGWAIALLSGTAYSDGATYYEVVRVAPSNLYMPINRTRDYAKARQIANRAWAAELAAA